MNESIRSFTLALALAAAAALGTVATAQAQTVINTLPYTITSSGLYVLNSNLNSAQTTGSLITVNASNVTIDFQDHYIAGAVGKTNQVTKGIYANEQSNVTIKNGTIAYCYTGIYLSGNNTNTTNAVGARILNMRITYCYYEGIEMLYQPSSLITGCQFSQIGYSTSLGAIGISILGSGCTVEGNQVTNVFSSSSSSTYCILSGNGCFIKNNKVTNAKIGISGGIYQDNMAFNCSATPFSGGTDGGGNVSQ